VIGWFGERHNRTVLTKLPYCDRHYHYWEKRDHRQHLGLLIMALGWLITLVVTFINNNNVTANAFADVQPNATASQYTGVGTNCGTP